MLCFLLYWCFLSVVVLCILLIGFALVYAVCDCLLLVSSFFMLFDYYFLFSISLVGIWILGLLSRFVSVVGFTVVCFGWVVLYWLDGFWLWVGFDCCGKLGLLF